ncbi:hypothetical protein PQO01_12375 [Lentisphaera marina]|uniref:hypothetical protein n=1 Tax=Lentisphaera marina TaxID=1111041 RepID=UPI0023654CF4|nr:hypothetical protein [Lentisphaera marina]MDD7985748.1 hypothetical protein [Lentisphaera marina]
MNIKILTESLYITLSIIIISGSMKYVRRGYAWPYLALISSCVALSISVRPAGYFYIISIIILVLLYQPKIKLLSYEKVLALTVPVLLILFTSSIIYKSYHHKKLSLLPAHLFGRGLTLMQESDIVTLPPTLKDKAPVIIELNNKINALDGFNIRHLARTRTEVMYQHQINHKLNDEQRFKVGKELIRNHKMAYCKITALHFFHLWTGFEVFSINESNSFWEQSKNWKKPDFIDQYRWNDTLVKKRRTFPLSFLRWSLLVLLISVLIAPLLAFFQILKKTGKKNNYFLLAGFFSSCCIGHSIIISMIGIATLRYTLILTPFLIINLFCLIYPLVTKTNNYLSTDHSDKTNKENNNEL